MSERALIDEILASCRSCAASPWTDEANRTHEKQIWRDIPARFRHKYDGGLDEMVGDYWMQRG